MHVLEDAAAEIGDIEAVDDDQLVMELGHCTFLPCGSIWGGPTTPRAYELSFAQMCGRRKGEGDQWPAMCWPMVWRSVLETGET